MNKQISQNLVSVVGLNYRYRVNKPLVLNNLNFEAAQGEIVLVTGASGSGKSTFCHCVSGIETLNPDGEMSGEILINGKNIYQMRAAERTLEVGIVFQNPDNQLFLFSVEDEIAFAQENLCKPPELIKDRVNYLLDFLGITTLRNSHPHKLSGGEKTLVALAGVLALDPKVLIMDEIMSQLDEKAKKRVADVIKKLKHMGKTIIMVDHNIKDIPFADHLILLENGKMKLFGYEELGV